MLHITIPEQELFDEKTNEFVYTKRVNLSLEHSLVSISKWEAIYNKPFIASNKKETRSTEEILKYIECMTITQNVDKTIYQHLPNSVIKQITEYIESPQSATTFSRREGKGPSTEIITSEMIYYYMTVFNIPFECEKWPLNRLLTLIRICSIKNSPKQKMSKNEIMRRNTALNAARRQQYNTNG